MNTAYSTLIRQLRGTFHPHAFSPIDALSRVKPVTYAATNGASTLRPRPVTNSVSVWRSHFQYDGFIHLPADDKDQAYRSITSHIAANGAATTSFPLPKAVGVFDPNKLPAFDPLTHVPLGGFEPSQASPADAATSTALQGRDLLPNANLGGFLSQPPQLITTLSALPTLENTAAFSGNLSEAHPISAIRVRVSGVSGVTALSRARVNLVAQDIIQKTGLQVDITTGSSPSTRVTDLPAGKYGRPPLQLREGWIDKGVALQIVHAVDRKSLILFVLVLTVCGLFVLNVATAAVRARRQHLGVLACIGWTRQQLFFAIMTELAIVGLVAGVLGVATAVPIAAATSLHITVLRSAIAILAAIALSCVAALSPALAASRARPLEAIRPVVASYRATIPVHSVIGLAFRNLVRGRTRSTIAALGLAVGVASSVFLVALTRSFNGQVAGDLLGQAVILQVRGVDYAAVIVMVVLGAAGIADVLYLNVRERNSELATLQATGWTRGLVVRLISAEGAALGLIGSLIGVIAGTAMVTSFTSDDVGAVVPLALIALVLGTVLGGLMAVLPVHAMPRRLSRALTD